MIIIGIIVNIILFALMLLVDVQWYWALFFSIVITWFGVIFIYNNSDIGADW